MAAGIPFSLYEFPVWCNRPNSLVEALSKNMGQLHYLRTVCFGPNDQKWRDYASRMMNIETAGDGAQRRQLIRAFNAGYYQEEGRHAQYARRSL